MTKKELLAFIRKCPDDVIIMVDTEDYGLLPMCDSESGMATDEDGNHILILAPCYHALDEAIEEEISINPIERVISECDEPELN